MDYLRSPYTRLSMVVSSLFGLGPRMSALSPLSSPSGCHVCTSAVHGTTFAKLAVRIGTLIVLSGIHQNSPTRELVHAGRLSFHPSATLNHAHAFVRHLHCARNGALECLRANECGSKHLVMETGTINLFGNRNPLILLGSWAVMRFPPTR